MITNPQTEARAILKGMSIAYNGTGGFNVAVERIATALAAKDAELAQVIKTGFERCADITARAERAEAQLAEANKALDLIASCTSHHPTDVVAIARRAREAQGGE